MKNNLDLVLHQHATGEKNLAVVQRKHLFGGTFWTGVKELEEEELFKLLSAHLEFHERTEELEKDETLKQIIPYFVIRKENKYLTAVRKTSGGDKRLHGSRLIGFGGHLRAEDIKGPMSEWLKREFDEEIEAEKIKAITFLGVINDDSEANSGTGKVHLGLAFEIRAEGHVKIKEEETFEQEDWMDLDNLETKTIEMESWSALLTNFLTEKN